MGVISKIARKGILKSIFKGFLDMTVIAPIIESNINSKEGGKGKPDWVRFVTAAGLILAILYMISKGYITVDEGEVLIKATR